MRPLLTAATLAAVLVSSSAWAWDQYPFDNYAQRSDTLTLGAGNARDRNTVIHMINPWPPYAFDRRIPGNGARAARAAECYEARAGSDALRPTYDPGREGGIGAGGGGGGGVNVQINQGSAQGSQGRQSTRC